MGLSPLAGVPMGTRAGDIDTCVAQFIMDKYNMTADECLTMLNKKSGVLALSNGVSSDFRASAGPTTARGERPPAAPDKSRPDEGARGKAARRRRPRGGAAGRARGRGGGESGTDPHPAPIWVRVGIPRRRRLGGGGGGGGGGEGGSTRAQQGARRGSPLISADDSRVKVWVIPTNEELMIAQDTAALCGK